MHEISKYTAVFQTTVYCILLNVSLAMQGTATVNWTIFIKSQKQHASV